jgi:hypothetical protein
MFIFAILLLKKLDLKRGKLAAEEAGLIPLATLEEEAEEDEENI